MTTGRINQVVMHPEKLFKHWIAVQPKGEPYVFQRYNNAKRTFTEADQYYAIPLSNISWVQSSGEPAGQINQ